MRSVYFMKSKVFLVMAGVFLISTIYDSMQIIQYGITNCSVRFLVSYVINIGGMVSFYLSYRHYKKIR